MRGSNAEQVIIYHSSIHRFQLQSILRILNRSGCLFRCAFSRAWVYGFIIMRRNQLTAIS